MQFKKYNNQTGNIQWAHTEQTSLLLRAEAAFFCFVLFLPPSPSFKSLCSDLGKSTLGIISHHGRMQVSESRDVYHKREPSKDRKVRGLLSAQRSGDQVNK